MVAVDSIEELLETQEQRLEAGAINTRAATIAEVLGLPIEGSLADKAFMAFLDGFVISYETTNRHTSQANVHSDYQGEEIQINVNGERKYLGWGPQTRPGGVYFGDKGWVTEFEELYIRALEAKERKPAA